MKNTIRAIEFAIKHWFDIDWENNWITVWYWITNRTEKYLEVETEIWFIYPLKEIITSAPFIDWLAIGLEDEDNFWWNWLKYKTLQEWIISWLWFAIYNGDIEDYFKNLIPEYAETH